MKKIITYILILISLTLSTGCGGGDQNINEIGGSEVGAPQKIQGSFQKGPFISGTPITIQELDDNLAPTGTSYSINTKDDLGSYQLETIPNSLFVEIIGTGYYFNEVKGDISNGTINLRVFANAAQSQANINALTTLSSNRIKYLINNEGKTFSEAKTQSQREILEIFNIDPENVAAFENMSISDAGESNAILLALSVTLQGNLSVGELSEFLSKIILDIEPDGIIDSEALLDQICENAAALNPNDIRSNLENRYNTLGADYDIPDFEHYLDRDCNGTLNKDEETSISVATVDDNRIYPTSHIFTVSLAGRMPDSDVNLVFSTTNTDAIALPVETVTFTKENYLKPQTIELGNKRAFGNNSHKSPLTVSMEAVEGETEIASLEYEFKFQDSRLYHLATRLAPSPGLEVCIKTAPPSEDDLVFNVRFEPENAIKVLTPQIVLSAKSCVDIQYESLNPVDEVNIILEPQTYTDSFDTVTKTYNWETLFW